MTANKYELVNTTTGKKSVLEARSGTLGPECLSIANLARDHGAFTFDPGFMFTAACESKITFIDGDAGICCTAATRRAACPKSSFEVAYLLMNGEHERRPASASTTADPYHDAERDAAAFLQRLPPARTDGDGVRGRRLDGGVPSRPMDIHNRGIARSSHRIIAKIRRSRRRREACSASRSCTRATT
jgi:citrate synthase